MNRNTALKLMLDELDRATEQHGEIHSCHEGYAIIAEELDELWAEIKTNNGSAHQGVSEAVQTAAMALRYLIDLCAEPRAVEHEQKIERWSSLPSYGGYGSYSG